MLTRLLVLSLCLGLAACDDDEGDDTTVEDDGENKDAGAEGCMDGDTVVPTGDSRECDCPDGSKASQQCLATGEFGGCSCSGW